jgi:inosine-uridine nucleoside N-ribohydrolase
VVSEKSEECLEEKSTTVIGVMTREGTTLAPAAFDAVRKLAGSVRGIAVRLPGSGQRRRDVKETGARWLALVALVTVALLGSSAARAQGGTKNAPLKIIFDTDFAVPPQDDGMALILALKSPELQILGVTTVAGNETMQRATSDALRVLEIANRTDIPVYRGFNRPLVHEKSDFATRVHGKWWSDEAPAPPPGGFAKKQAEKQRALDFIIETVDENPGQITIIALGPLTNIAAAIQQEPGFAKKVKQIVIMGGAVAYLEGGGGNVTPNAEFNFWVDPEAAQVVIRSGIPCVLTPLNVTRKTAFTKNNFEQIVAANTPLTNLMKETMGPFFEKYPDAKPQMYDQLTVASLVDPTLVKAQDLFVDVDIAHGPDYGTSLGFSKIWEYGEEAHKVSVQYDVDFERFMKMFIERVTRP